jgi:hypothetical protein
MRKTLINIDINTRNQITATGEFVNRISDYVQIERGVWQILCFQFYDRQVTEEGAISLVPYALESGGGLVLSGDSDFNDDNDLMFKAISNNTAFNPALPETSNCFNIEGDWIDGGTADVSQGQLSVRILTHTQKFRQALGDNTLYVRNCYVSLKQIVPNSATFTALAFIPFTAYNTVNGSNGADYYDIPDDSAGFIQNYLDYALRNNKLEFRYRHMLNGDWTITTSPFPTSEEMSMRITNLGQAWSNWIPCNKYIHIRYADDDQGTNISETPLATSYYIAILASPNNRTPVNSDFDGLWVKIRGIDYDVNWNYET